LTAQVSGTPFKPIAFVKLAPETLRSLECLFGVIVVARLLIEPGKLVVNASIVIG
jgi:hypothetical protein